MRHKLFSKLIVLCVSVSAYVDGASAETALPCPSTSNSSEFFFNMPALDHSLFVVKGSRAADETSAVWIESNLGNSQSTYLCSGALIGSNRILTAAHCVCPNCRMTVGFGPDLKSPSDKIRVNVVNISLHPRYQKTGPSMQQGFDLAVLFIDDYASCPAYKRAVPIYAIDAAVAAKEVRIVGYGQTELPGVFGEKKKAEVFMGSVTCTQSWARRAGCVSFREFVLKSFAFSILGGELGSDTCKGDSGGPAYVVGEGNTRYLLGVTSRALIPKGGFQNEGCGFGGIYEYVGIPEVADWLRNVVPDLQIVTK